MELIGGNDFFPGTPYMRIINQSPYMYKIIATYPCNYFHSMPSRGQADNKCRTNLIWDISFI